MSSKLQFTELPWFCGVVSDCRCAYNRLNWKEMRQVLGQANWFLLAPLFCLRAFVLCLGFSLAIVFRVSRQKKILVICLE